MEVAWRILN